MVLASRKFVIEQVPEADNINSRKVAEEVTVIYKQCVAYQSLHFQVCCCLFAASNVNHC